MQLPQRARLLLLLALLALCLPLGWADDNAVKSTSTTTSQPKGLAAPGCSTAFVSLALGLATAFLLRLF